MRFGVGGRVHEMGKKLIVAAVFMLTVMPFWMTFADVLTRAVMKVGGYREIQNVVVPYQLRVVGVVLRSVGLPVQTQVDFFEFQRRDGSSQYLHMAWNCVGWQTWVLMVVTLGIGLRGKYTWGSRLMALGIGLLGTYLVNVVRLAAVVVVYFGGGRVVGRVFHDYSSSIIALTWLFGYWRYIYKHVLRDKI